MLKLINNSSYGYFGMRPDHGKGCRLHLDAASCRQAAYKCPNADVKVVCFDEQTGVFIGMTKKHSKKPVVVKTARIVMWAILEWAKLKIYDFHYNHMKAIFGDAYKIGYTDTDSIHYCIEWPTAPEHAMFEHDKRRLEEGLAPVFDLSKYKAYKDRTPHSGTMGVFKDEYGDDRVVEETALGKKLYRLRRMSHKEVVKGKGMPNAELKRQYSSDDYWKALYHGEAKQASFNRMLRKDLILEHTTVTKFAIATVNEAVFLVSPNASRPLGHYKNAEERTVLRGWDPLVDIPPGLHQEPEAPIVETIVLVDEADDVPMEAADAADAAEFGSELAYSEGQEEQDFDELEE
jgi:hypothetical protein